MIRNLVFLRGGALLGVLAGWMMVGFAIPAPAAAKVSSLTGCQNIVSPGKYRLDTDIITGRSVCLGIFVNGVTLDLNGHTISGPGVIGTGILQQIGRVNANIVGPGTVTGWHTAIFLRGGNATQPMANDVVVGVTATNNVVGIDLEGSGNSVRGNVVTDNSGDGIAATRGSSGNTVIGNYAHGNGTFDLIDINDNCDSNVWRGNDFGTASQPCIT